MANSVVYFVRLCLIDSFRIEKIRFQAEQLSFNQDGLHFGGGCRNGWVEDVGAVTDGETNDDLLALNADDSMVRLENLDLVCGDIENITFRNIYAENCYTIVRLLSVEHAIRNIRFFDVHCGCRKYAVNMDGARYCRTPLFQEEEYPRGCGCIEDVLFENMTVYSTDDGVEEGKTSQDAPPLILGETRCRRLSIRNFCRDTAREKAPLFRPTLSIGNLVGAHVTVGDQMGERQMLLEQKQDRLLRAQSFQNLSITCDDDTY